MKRLLALFSGYFITFLIIGCGATLPPNISAIKTPGNIAYQATVTASSSYTDPPRGLTFSPATVVDGITFESHYPETFWLLPDRTTGFLKIDLIKIARIRSIRILNTHNDGFNDRGTKDFHVEAVLPDGRTELIWRDRFLRIGGWLERTLDNLRAQSIGIYIDSFYGHGGGINEVEIYGDYEMVLSKAIEESTVEAITDTKIRPRIAVFSLKSTTKAATDEGYGDVVSEMLITGLIKTGRFEVLERAQIKQIMSERQFTEADVIAGDKAVNVGKMLKVKYLVIGSVAKLHNFTEVDVRFIDTDNGKALLAENVSCQSMADLRNAINHLVNKISTGYLGRLTSE